MKRLPLFCLLLLFLIAVILPVSADSAVLYSSQPDELVVFLNGVAFARDTIVLPGDADIQIVLPSSVYTDTLILRENGERVAQYRVLHTGSIDPYSATSSAETRLEWASETSDLREVTLEYLMTGVRWQPKYDLFLRDEAVETTVELDFFAEITSDALLADAVLLKLAAGRVDISQPIEDISRVTANQYAAGYAILDGEQGGVITGVTSIQHLYDAGTVALEPGSVLYTRLTGGELPARKVLLWNAATDNQVTVIYKVLNELDMPFAEGIVRSYQNNLFLGSDFVELTPPGSEGSVTVGYLQTMRVNRTQATTDVSSFVAATQYDITLTLTNFSDEAMTIDVVDNYPVGAGNFVFSGEPERQGNNQFRWTVTVPAGEDMPITYQYRV
jgi:hypothetical protein